MPVDEVTQWAVEEAYATVLELHEAELMHDEREKAEQRAAVEKSRQRAQQAREAAG